MLRLSVAVVSLCLLAAGSAAARPTAPAKRTAVSLPAVAFAISGRGWGHGVGMSQYGAKGFAERGSDYASILAHYYSGTQLAQAGVGRVRVLLADTRKSLPIGSEGAFTIRDATGRTVELDATILRLGPGLRVRVDPVGEPTALTGPLVFTGRGAPLRVEGKRYRGTVEVSVVNGKLRAVNHVGLEAYLFGVVPDEVPSHWPAEALKAQSVVARSYALAVRKTGGAFDLYRDTRSQVYGGLDAEEPETTAAVLGTVGQVLQFDGRIATTYFFSTSGGRTADVRDVWSGTNPIPYLVSVPDPYDNASPHHVWGPFRFTSARLDRALRLAAPPVDARVTLNGSKRASELVLVDAAGVETVVPAATARRQLGLRSTWFRVGVLGLDVPLRRTVTFGSALELTGRARAIAGVTVEHRVPGGPWLQVAIAKPSGGVVKVAVKPQAIGDFRLVGAKLATAPLRINVAALVRLAAPTSRTELRGLVRPVVPGATVAIQRRAPDGRWTKVGTATLDDNGAFAAALELVPGTYRARVAPGRGVVPGVSKILNVVDA